MEKLIVDRITENIAILEKEDKSHIQVPLEKLDFEIRQGNVLFFDGENYILDTEQENIRRSRIFSLQEKLRNKNNK